jgi:Ca-activated chloride channel family protein
VRPDEDIETHVSRMYRRISAPVMVDVAVEFDLEGIRVEDGRAVNRVYPADVHDLFAGEQLVLVGRYRKPGDAKVIIQGRVGKEKQKFDFPAKLIQKSNDESYAFVEKLWAMRRIGEIIDELDLKGKNDELIKELVALSTKHGILTPYTSFLADDNAPTGLATNSRQDVDRASLALRRLGESAGRAAFAQRAEKKMLREAQQVPLASGYAPAAAEEPADGIADQRGAYGGAMGGGGAATPGPAVRYRNIETDEEVIVDSVQIVGKQTLYKRGKQWFAANARDVDLVKDADKVVTVTRYSDEYFTLTAANTESENAVLARQKPGEELIIRLRGQIYLIR